MFIDSGQIVGLFGLNGVGKIICFYMIVGLVQVDQGVVCIDEQNVIYLLMYGCVWVGIGYLLQEVLIFCKLLVFDNIMVIFEICSDFDCNGCKEVLEGLLQEFYIYYICDNFGMSLFGGE